MIDLRLYKELKMINRARQELDVWASADLSDRNAMKGVKEVVEKAKALNNIHARESTIVGAW